eukprot:m.554648 g.554648  ORF g.554648 m.554648 type:complete len:225 (+) comp22178_c0_seq5:120-794(+)
MVTAECAAHPADNARNDPCRCVSTDPHNPRFKLDIENITMHMHHCLNTTGRQLWFNFHCPNSGGTSPDTVPEWCPAAGNSYRVGPDHHDYWPNTAHAIDILKHGAMWSATGPNTNTTGWNDPDFLMTGGAGCDRSVQGGGLRCPGQTDVEYKTEFSLWTMAAAQLLVATDVRQITPFMREVLLNLELIAVNQDPLGGMCSCRMIRSLRGLPWNQFRASMSPCTM